MSLSAVLPSTSAPRQKHLHARLARAHALCSTGGGDCTRWARLLRHRGSPWVSVSTCRVMPMPGRMTDFTQLSLECNVPATIVALLGSFDASLLARSGTSVQEQEDFITHFIDAASITDVAEKFLARASLRLLYSKCRLAIPSLESPPAVPPLEPAGAPGSGSGTGGPTPPPLSSSWQESWPAKLSLMTSSAGTD